MASFAGALALVVGIAWPVAPRAETATVIDSVPMPPKVKISYGYDAFYQGLARPAARSLDPARLVRRVTGAAREAANVDEQDRVQLPSSFWQPRVGFKPVSVDAMLHGAGPGTGPAKGPWSIVKAKTLGVSKGFEIKDSEGARFAIKFDPLKDPEMGSSADVVVSKLLWAAGYNVPDNTIAYFRRADLVVGKDATHSAHGKALPITEAFLDELLRGMPALPDGRYRVVASRYLAGKPIGEWRFTGVHREDPEDRIPHELRRELRGLWTISAWVNHTDASARNNLDMYVKDGGRSFVRHHLIDFSGCLGSASIEPQPMRAGHEYIVDYGAMSASLVTLGMRRGAWERSVEPELRGVGFIDAATFRPEQWRPYLPNPAFDECTDRDKRWGARIVAAFSDDLIRAAVESGEYTDPAAVEYLVLTLRQRRDKIAAAWLTPKERESLPPAVVAGEIGVRGRLLDVALDRGLALADSFAYVAGWNPPVPLAADAQAATDSLVTPSPSAMPLPDTTATSEPIRIVVPDASASAPPPPHDRPNLPTRMGRAAGHFFSDGWYIATSPTRLRGRGLLWTGLVLGIEGVIYANDQAIHDASVRNRDETGYEELVNVGQVVEPIGFMGNTNPYYAGAIVLGYAFDVRPLRMIPAQILESHFIAGGLRNVGKYLVGRRHPYEENKTSGPYEFDFGHGTSFPSGHTSVYFELATIGSMHAKRWPVTVALYSAAVAGAAQRVESFNHWPSDVFISAVYGTLISRTVVKLHEKREARGDAKTGVSLSPWFESDGRIAGLRLDHRF